MSPARPAVAHTESEPAMPILLDSGHAAGSGRRLVPQRGHPPRAARRVAVAARARTARPASRRPGPAQRARCSAGWSCAAGAPTARAPISPRYPLVELAPPPCSWPSPSQVARLHCSPRCRPTSSSSRPASRSPRSTSTCMRLPNAIVYPAYPRAGRPARPSPPLVDGTPEPLLRAGDRRRRAVRLLPRAGGRQARRDGLRRRQAGRPHRRGRSASCPTRRCSSGRSPPSSSAACRRVLLLCRAAPPARPRIPFGPSMIAGALVALFASAPIADAYAHFVHRALSPRPEPRHEASPDRHRTRSASSTPTATRSAWTSAPPRSGPRSSPPARSRAARRSPCTASGRSPLPRAPSSTASCRSRPR